MRYAEVDLVGEVVEGTGAELVSNGEVHDFTPRFRESAYTSIKKPAGEKAPADYARLRGCDRPRLRMDAAGNKERVVARVMEGLLMAIKTANKFFREVPSIPLTTLSPH